MPGDGSESDISESRDQPVTHKWRSRILSTAGKLGKAVEKVTRERSTPAQQENDLSDFLHGSDDKAAIKPRADPSSSLHWPSAVSVLDSTEKPGRSSSAPATALSSTIPSYTRRTKRTTQGLHVSFTTNAPVIIGEGGDEAELPSKDVFRSHALPNAVAPPSQGRSATDVGGDRGSAVPSNQITPPSERRTQHSPPPRGLTAIQRKPVARLELTNHAEEITELGPRSRDNGGYSTPYKPEKGFDHAMFLPESPGHVITSRPGTSSSSSTLPQGLRSGAAESQDASGFAHPGIQKPTPMAIHGRLAAPLHNLSQESILSNPNTRSLYAADTLGQRTPNVSGNEYMDILSPYLESSTDDRSLQDRSSINESINSNDNDNGFDEFYSRIEHLRGTFKLAAEKFQSMETISLATWIRASTWWFLKGRSGLEDHIRAVAQQSSESLPRSESSLHVQQSQIDLAKCWWIMQDIVASRIQQAQNLSDGVLDNADGLGLSTLLQAHAALQTSMRTLMISMEKRHLLPPNSLLPTQGADTRIWVEYPHLPSKVLALTSDLDLRAPSKRQVPGGQPNFAILLRDTDRHFSYGRMFVEVGFISEHEELDQYQLPCILSILRERTDSRVESTIVSQDGQINLHIRSDKLRGTTWNDVEWKVRFHSMRILLAPGVELAVKFWERDFKSLWGIYEYNRRVERDWHEQENETVVFNDVADILHYVPTSDSNSTFPTKPIRICKIRLLERSSKGPTDIANPRKICGGHRLVTLTPPGNKLLNSLSMVFSPLQPIIFSYLRGEAGAPALLLSMRDQNTKSRLILTFREVSKRNELHALLNNTSRRLDESASEHIPLDNFTILPLVNESVSMSKELSIIPEIKWKSVKIIHKDPNVQQSNGSGDSRMCLECSLGCITDPINSGLGELQIGFDTTDLRKLKLLRHQQQDLIISFAENLLAKGDWQRLSDTLSTAASTSTSRVYQFPSLQDLHQFEAHVTGFVVSFDGFASRFSISRRRMVVPIHKHLEEAHVRLQVIYRDSNTQLVAVFSGNTLGRCMNFALKGTDTLESFTRSGKFFVRFVDAKFSMPKREIDKDWDFVSLDILEYPGEHDDIVIGFDTEEERDKFGVALPASIGKASRLASFRK